MSSSRVPLWAVMFSSLFGVIAGVVLVGYSPLRRVFFPVQERREPTGRVAKRQESVVRRGVPNVAAPRVSSTRKVLLHRDAPVVKRASLQYRMTQASDLGQLTQKGKLSPGAGFLLGQRWLSVSQLKEKLKLPAIQSLRVSVLQGIQRSVGYDALLYSVKSSSQKVSSYGLGVQVWRVTPSQTKAMLAKRWERFRKRYPGVRPLPKDSMLEGFFASRRAIRYVLFRTKVNRSLVVLSCHESMCSDVILLSLTSLFVSR